MPVPGPELGRASRTCSRVPKALNSTYVPKAPLQTITKRADVQTAYRNLWILF